MVSPLNFNCQRGQFAKLQWVVSINEKWKCVCKKSSALRDWLPAGSIIIEYSAYSGDGSESRLQVSYTITGPVDI